MFVVCGRKKVKQVWNEIHFWFWVNCLLFVRVSLHPVYTDTLCRQVVHLPSHSCHSPYASHLERHGDEPSLSANKRDSFSSLAGNAPITPFLQNESNGVPSARFLWGNELSDSEGAISMCGPPGPACVIDTQADKTIHLSFSKLSILLMCL